MLKAGLHAVAGTPLTGFGVYSVGRQMFDECYRRENKDALGTSNKGTYSNLESGKPHPRSEDEG